MKTVKAWCVKKPDGELIVNSINYDKKLCQTDCDGFSRWIAYDCKVVPVEIKEVENENSKSVLY